MPRGGDRSEAQLRVLTFLKEHPGATNQEIREHLGPEFHMGRVTNLLTTLKFRHNAVENRGGHAAAGRWFLKEPPDSPYFEQAQVILSEMESLWPAFRAEYLAKKLEEVATETPN